MAKTLAAIVMLALLLTGCAKRTACVDGRLYYRDASEVLVRDEWDRLCVEEKQP